jgi:hypothetical protein
MLQDEHTGTAVEVWNQCAQAMAQWALAAGAGWSRHAAQCATKRGARQQTRSPDAIRDDGSTMLSAAQGLQRIDSSMRALMKRALRLAADHLPPSRCISG